MRRAWLIPVRGMWFGGEHLQDFPAFRRNEAGASRWIGCNGVPPGQNPRGLVGSHCELVCGVAQQSCRRDSRVVSQRLWRTGATQAGTAWRFSRDSMEVLHVSGSLEAVRHFNFNV
eukprot:1402872-Rhodomonas_salina.2